MSRFSTQKGMIPMLMVGKSQKQFFMLSNLQKKGWKSLSNSAFESKMGQMDKIKALYYIN